MAAQKQEVPVRNMTYIHSDDPRYHEAITDLINHLGTLKATVAQQQTALNALQVKSK